MQAPVDHDTHPSVAVSAQPAPGRHPATHRVTVWPVVAFWVGAALLFGVGGGLNAVRFGDILLHARGNWQNLSAFQVAWLATALFFFACGIISISLALLLTARSAGGFYGSLLFGLLLTLLAPLVSLLTPDPDYFGVLCAGLLPGAAVLFTLVSLPAFSGD
jgi:hypothetical protein